MEENRFLAGECPDRFEVEQARKRIDALLDVDTFINLTKPNEMPSYLAILQEEARMYGVEAEYPRFAIGDFGLPSTTLMKSMLDQIDASLQAGRKVYLHCWGGGRTGTTVGCYLVRRGYSGEQADFIRNWQAHETPGDSLENH